MVQPEKTLASEARESRFESWRVHSWWMELGQVERLTVNQEVAGSNPVIHPFGAEAEVGRGTGLSRQRKRVRVPSVPLIDEDPEQASGQERSWRR